MCESAEARRGCQTPQLPNTGAGTNSNFCSSLMKHLSSTPPPRLTTYTRSQTHTQCTATHTQCADTHTQCTDAHNHTQRDTHSQFYKTIGLRRCSPHGGPVDFVLKNKVSPNTLNVESHSDKRLDFQTVSWGQLY